MNNEHLINATTCLELALGEIEDATNIENVTNVINLCYEAIESLTECLGAEQSPNSHKH